jgi:hypothetical protein
MGWANVFGDYFTNSSGHPAGGPCHEKKLQAFIYRKKWAHFFKEINSGPRVKKIGRFSFSESSK